jgi:hypothetical protein
VKVDDMRICIKSCRKMDSKREGVKENNGRD